MRRVLPALDHIFEALACVILTALLASVTLGVVTRAFNDPLIWTDEVSRFLMVWLAVFGWILASRRRSHVRIRFFQDLLPGPGRTAAEMAFQAAILLFGIAVAGYGVGLTVRNLDLEATTVPISFAWMYAPMVLAGVVTAGQAVGDIIELGRRHRAPATANEGAIE